MNGWYRVEELPDPNAWGSVFWVVKVMGEQEGGYEYEAMFCYQSDGDTEETAHGWAQGRGYELNQ